MLKLFLPSSCILVIFLSCADLLGTAKGTVSDSDNPFIPQPFPSPHLLSLVTALILTN